MDPLFGGLIAGGLSSIGNIIGNQLSFGQNKKLADYYFDKNLEMWKIQNEYNSPASQMARLKRAGLNPNLMYGQGNVGNASSAPEYNMPEIKSNFGDLGLSQASQQLFDGLLANAQIKKVEAETENIRQNTVNAQQQHDLGDLRLVYQELLNDQSAIKRDNLSDYYKSLISNLDQSSIHHFASSRLADSQRFFTDAQKERLNILTPLVEQQMEIQIRSALFDLTNLKPAQIAKLESDVRYQRSLAKLSDYKSQLMFYELEYGKENAFNNSEYIRLRKEYQQAETEFRNYMHDEHIDRLNGVIKALSPLSNQVFERF